MLQKFDFRHRDNIFTVMETTKENIGPHLPHGPELALVFFLEGVISAGKQNLVPLRVQYVSRYSQADLKN